MSLSNLNLNLTSNVSGKNVNNLTPSPICYFIEKHYESLELESYRKSGDVWTIGWGHTSGVRQGMTCSIEQANQWLISDNRFPCFMVNKAVMVPLNQNQFDSLIDFSFNLGTNALYTSTLLKFVNSGRFDLAVSEFVKWDHMGGIELLGLKRRRLLEARLFGFDGVMDEGLLNSWIEEIERNVN